MQSHLSVFYFVACVFAITSKKSLPNTLLGRLSPMFPNSSGDFIVWGNTFIFFLIYLAVRSQLQQAGPWLHHAGSFIPALRLSSYGMWAQQLQQVGSLVVVHGFSCPMACGILVPRLGIEPASPVLQGRFLTTRSLGSPQGITFRSLIHFEFIFAYGVR